MNSFNQKLEEISIKVIDFNVFDMLKNRDGETDTNIDMIQIMVNNIEKKLLQKIGFVDDRSKKTEDEVYKLKNDLASLKSTQETQGKNINSIKETIETVFTKIEEYKTYLLKTLDDNIENTNNNINQQITKFTEYFEEKITEINNRIQSILDQPLDNNNANQNGLSEGDLKLIRDLQKRVTDLEKNLKFLSSTINIEQINKEILKLTELINQKSNQQDLLDLKDLYSKIFFIN